MDEQSYNPELDDTYEPDYLVEARQLSDREIQDFRYMFLDFCAYRVHTDQL